MTVIDLGLHQDHLGIFICCCRFYLLHSSGTSLAWLVRL